MKLSLNDIKKALKGSPKPQRLPSPEVLEYFRVREIELAPYRLYDELWLVPEYISSALEEDVLDKALHSSEWTTLRNRSVAVAGGTVTSEGLTGHQPLPRYLDIFAQRLFDEKIFSFKPNHVLINEYHRGDGIMPHSDGPAYFPLVATLSLGSATTITFCHNANREPLFSVVLPPRSLLLFTGDLYYNKLHGIDTVPADLFYSDSCGKMYTKTQEGTLSEVLNFTGGPEPSEVTSAECPICGGDLICVSEQCRALRVSFTIRYVPQVVSIGKSP